MSGDKNLIAAMFVESDMSYREHKMLQAYIYLS